MTLDEQISKEIRGWETYFARQNSYTNGEFYDLSKAEIEVFQINLERYPAMVTAWFLYGCVIDIFTPEDVGFTSEAIEEERKLWPDFKMRSVDEAPFSALAKKRVGITQREAAAIYHKIGFWEARVGLLSYQDELH